MSAEPNWRNLLQLCLRNNAYRGCAPPLVDSYAAYGLKTAPVTGTHPGAACDSCTSVGCLNHLYVVAFEWRIR